jgi:hypothetical protein
VKNAGYEVHHYFLLNILLSYIFSLYSSLNVKYRVLHRTKRQVKVIFCFCILILKFLERRRDKRLNRKVAIQLKTKIYKGISLRFVLYGCETWFLTVNEHYMGCVFENRALRGLFGPKREEVAGAYIRLHNEVINCTRWSKQLRINVRNVGWEVVDLMRLAQVETSGVLFWTW